MRKKPKSFMKLKKLSTANVKGKTVLVRVGFDVPVSAKGKVEDDFRLRRSIPTVRWLLRHGAKVVLLAHRGEPHGKFDGSLSLKPVAKAFGKLIRKPVTFVPHTFGNEKAVARMKPGSVLLLENLRFAKGEERADKKYAQTLATLGDLFVNDDFSTSHRNHATISVLPQLLPAYAGLNLVDEVKALERLQHNVARPFVALIGGKKIHDKLTALEMLFPNLDAVLLGGGAANTLLKMQGQHVGRSIVDTKIKKKDVEKMVRSQKIDLPIDSRIAKNISANKATNVPLQNIPSGMAILDIGQQTAISYAHVLATAKTVLWAGPFGYIENPVFRNGSATILKSIPKKAFSVAGGGDTVHMIDLLGQRSRFSFLSTGGGAMLAFLAGEPMPGFTHLQ